MSKREFSESNYQQFSHFLEQRTGIVLGDAKQYLVRSRLVSFLHEFPDENLDSIIQLAIQGRDRTLQQRVIEAMTTNETLWFRDAYPFALLKQDVLPLLNTQRKIRVWSAACSTGQEAYSIAMTLLDYKTQNPQSLRGGFEILGTDISQRVLDVAKSGRYDAISVGRGLPQQFQQKYFTVKSDRSVEVKPELKRHVQFKPLNLLDSYTGLGKFDIIFCRNVLIYFSAENKKKILQQIAASMEPHGSLLLGASESVSSVANLFTMKKAIQGLYYQKKQAN